MFKLIKYYLKESNLSVYQCANFGALDPRINETMSHEVAIWFGSLRYRLPYSLFQRLSGLLTQSQCFPGHQGPLWTALYMSPLTRLCFDVDEGDSTNSISRGEILLKKMFHRSGFFLTTFTDAVGRILTNFQPCIRSCSCHRDPNKY